MRKSNRRQYVFSVIFIIIILLYLLHKCELNILEIIFVFVVVIALVIIFLVIDGKKGLSSSFERPKLYYDGKNTFNNLYKLSINDSKKKQYQINRYKRGYDGEKNVSYTLKNITNLPMYIIKDIRLQYTSDDIISKAQIDFILVTTKTIYILETKNLKGNIYIEDDGTFVRVVDGDKKTIKSPITQNSNHEKTLKYILEKEKINANIIPLVVIANDESYIQFENGKKNKYKKSIIRNDKLEEVLKKKEKGRKNIRKKSDIEYICDSILKYEIKNQKKDEAIIDELKKYRRNKSTEEGISAYMVYTDSTICDLVNKRPSEIEELNTIIGLGEYKINKYGSDIIKIINE